MSLYYFNFVTPSWFRIRAWPFRSCSQCSFMIPAWFWSRTNFIFITIATATTETRVFWEILSVRDFSTFLWIRIIYNFWYLSWKILWSETVTQIRTSLLFIYFDWTALGVTLNHMSLSCVLWTSKHFALKKETDKSLCLDLGCSIEVMKTVPCLWKNTKFR